MALGLLGSNRAERSQCFENMGIRNLGTSHGFATLRPNFSGA